MIVRTLFELLLIALLVLGFIYEDKIADFEQRLFLKIKRQIKEGKYGIFKR